MTVTKWHMQTSLAPGSEDSLERARQSRSELSQSPPGSVTFQDSPDAPITHSHSYLVIKRIWPREEAHEVQGPLPQATSSSAAGMGTHVKLCP